MTSRCSSYRLLESGAFTIYTDRKGAGESAPYDEKGPSSCDEMSDSRRCIAPVHLLRELCTLPRFFGTLSGVKHVALMRAIWSRN